MLSRVADNLYWMSRYLERAEHAARLLDVNLNLMLDESASSADRAGGGSWRRWEIRPTWRGAATPTRWRRSSPSIREIVHPSQPAWRRPARTRARYAKKSAPTSGSGLTICFTR